MRPYQVVGAAVQISPSTALILSAPQVAARKHLVKEIEKIGEDAVRVESLALLTFKVGEVIGLAEVPKQAREHLVDLQAADEARRAGGGEHPDQQAPSRARAQRR